MVSLYHGGQYQLYKYKRYSPVKLVFAPELQAGFFGGDPDNFTYPRYDMDISFVRAYEPDSTTAAKTEHYFKWRPDGAKADELVFVTGNPGSTSRQITFAEVMYEKLYRHPFLIQLLSAQRTLLQQIAKMGPQAEQQVRQQLFEIENSLKSFEGQYAGLSDTTLLARKLRWEREFRAKVNADPKLKAQYGNVWDKLADIQLQKLRTSPRLNVSIRDHRRAPDLAFAAQTDRKVHDRDGRSRKTQRSRADTKERQGQGSRSNFPLTDAGAGRTRRSRRTLLTLQLDLMKRLGLEPMTPSLETALVHAGRRRLQQAASDGWPEHRVLDATVPEWPWTEGGAARGSTKHRSGDQARAAR